MRLVWLIFGLVSLGLGLVGLFLPLLPTTPLLLLAAFGFARSSTRLQDWLLTHPTFGPPILDWQQRRSIARRAKWAASLSILAAFSISLVIGIAPLYLVLQALVLLAVAAFIWTRPDA